MMGIVHHANYLYYFEEARVAFAVQLGAIKYNDPQSASNFAVLESQCRHLKPTFFGDELEVRAQVKLEGIRLHFQYQIWNLTRGHAVAVGQTSHAGLDRNLKLLRPSKEIVKAMENLKWTETWL